LSVRGPDQRTSGWIFNKSCKLHDEDPATISENTILGWGEENFSVLHSWRRILLKWKSF